MNTIEQILKKNGPMLSGELAKKYSETNVSSNDAARKAISRARSPVQKLKKFPFEKNQVYCYLEEQYNTSVYREQLYFSLKNYSASISVILIAFENNSGILNKIAINIYSSSPVSNVVGHRLISRNIKDLLELGLIYEYDDEHFMLNSNYSGIETNITYSNSNDRLCKIILSDFVLWATKVNMIAFNSAKVYPMAAEFAHFQWGVTCPSYLQSLYNQQENKPGFVVVDAIFGKNVTLSDISFFISKINIIRHFKHLPNFMPVLLITGATQEAFQLLKENKVFIGVLGNLFDENYTSVLMDIYNVFKNATALLLNDSSKIDILLENISKYEGRFNNAMGDLFEYMVGAFYTKQGVAYIEMNKLIPNAKGTKNELDILVSKDNKIIAIECKATKSPLSISYVEKWLSEIVPTFRSWMQQTYPSYSYEFQIWSVGGFDDKSMELLEKHKNTAKKYQLNYYCKQEILEKAKNANDTVLINQINKHFPSM